MSIRQQILYNNNRLYGRVDMGTEMDDTSDSIRGARNALVFKTVAINGGSTDGLFFNSVSKWQRASDFINPLLRVINLNNVQVCSITFDGAPVN